MAAPTVRAVGTAAHGTTGTVTPGLPTGTVEGDLLILLVGSDGGLNNTGGLGTWNLIRNVANGTATTDARLQVYWKVAGASESAPGVTGNTANHKNTRIIGITRGTFNIENPISVESGGNVQGSTTAVSITGLTTTINDCLIVSCNAASLPDSNSTAQYASWTNASLASITERVDNNSNQGNGGGIGAATGVDTTAGTVNATTVTKASAALCANLMFAIAPAGPMSDLTDNFDDNSFDTAQWMRTNGTQVVEQNQRLELSSILGGNYVGCFSVGHYDLTSSEAFLELVDGGNQSLASWEAYPLVLSRDSSNVLEWRLIGGTLQAYKRVGGSGSNQGSGITYNSSVHKWLRIREASGTTYWDYSTDGISWTNHTSLSNPFVLDTMRAEINVGTWQAEGSTTAMFIDNFNVAPTPPPSFTPSPMMHMMMSAGGLM